MTTNQNTQLDLFDSPVDIYITPTDTGGDAFDTLTVGTIGSGIKSAWYDITSTGYNDSIWATSIDSTLKVSGDAEIKGNLTVGGVNLMDTLQKIEQRLNILRVDPELEARWDELRELGEQYRALEAHILSKERLVDALMRDYNID